MRAAAPINVSLPNAAYLRAVHIRVITVLQLANYKEFITATRNLHSRLPPLFLSFPPFSMKNRGTNYMYKRPFYAFVSLIELNV